MVPPGMAGPQQQVEQTSDPHPLNASNRASKDSDGSEGSSSGSCRPLRQRCKQGRQGSIKEPAKVGLGNVPVAKPTRDSTLFSSEDILKGTTAVIPSDPGHSQVSLSPRKKLLGITHSSRQRKRAKVEESEANTTSGLGVIPDTLLGKGKWKSITPQEYLSRERSRALASL